MTDLEKLQARIARVVAEPDPRKRLVIFQEVESDVWDAEYELALAAYPDTCDPLGHYMTDLETGVYDAPLPNEQDVSS